MLYLMLYGYLMHAYGPGSIGAKAGYAYGADYLGEVAKEVEALLIKGHRPNGSYSDMACEAYVTVKPRYEAARAAFDQELFA